LYIYPEKYKFEQQISYGHPLAGKVEIQQRKSSKVMARKMRKRTLFSHLHVLSGRQEPDIQMSELRASDMQPKKINIYTYI